MSSGQERTGLTMLDKIWSKHGILDRADGETLLYVDRHLIHDGYMPAFEFLAARGLKPRSPHQIFGTPDHYVPTDVREVSPIPSEERRGMVESLLENSREYGITTFELADRRQGIVHVIGPEQGISQPGMTIVCADSHTSTHGALGALAFGVGMTAGDAGARHPNALAAQTEIDADLPKVNWALGSPPRMSSWPSSARSAPPARSGM